MWKANSRKRGQRDSVLHAITFHPTTRPRLFCSHFGVSQKNSMSPSNGELELEYMHVIVQRLLRLFFNNNESCHNKYSTA